MHRPNVGSWRHRRACFASEATAKAILRNFGAKDLQLLVVATVSKLFKGFGS